MRVVIYTEKMEPITIIDLPLWALQHGQRLGMVRVAVMEETRLIGLPPYRAAEITAEMACLEFHRGRFGQAEHYWITTRDEIQALRLEPSWLPGQQRKINEYERNKQRLANIILSALSRGVGGH